MKKTILIKTVLIFALVLLNILNPVRTNAQTSTATVSVIPRVTQVDVGGQVVVDIKVNNATNIASYSFVLSYNKNALQLNGDTDNPPYSTTVVNGTFLRSPANGISPIVNQTAGTVEYAAFSLAGLNTGVSGQGTLATITLTAIAAGTSSLSLSQVQLLQSDLDATAQQNTVTNNSVAINGVNPSASPGTSPQPTPSGTTQGSLTIQVMFESIVEQAANKQVLLTLKQAGQTVRSETILMSSNASGVYQNTTPITGITVGTYDIYVKGPIHLTRKFTNQTISAGDNTKNLTSPLLLAGDAVTNDRIDLQDYNQLVTDFGPRFPTSTGSTADLNFDGDVDIYDYSFFVGNFNKTGDQ